MIRTVTLSPGFDHEVHVGRIHPGEVGRVMSWRAHAAGKGMNVARFVKMLGAEVQACSLVGTLDEGRFRKAAAADGVHRHFRRPGQTRDNPTLTSEALGLMAGHASGPGLDAVPPEAVDRLVSKLLRDMSPDDILVLSGAIRDGLDVGTAPSTMTDLIGRLRDDSDDAAVAKAGSDHLGGLDLVSAEAVRARRPLNLRSRGLLH